MRRRAVVDEKQIETGIKFLNLYKKKLIKIELLEDGSYEFIYESPVCIVEGSEIVDDA